MAAPGSHRPADADGSRPVRRPAVRRRLVLAAAFVAVAFGAWRIVSPLVDGDDYAAVASIEQVATYQDPALLRRAWRLPVAARYAAGRYEFQANASFCGPTSVANLLRSIGRDATQRQVVDGTAYEPWFGVLPGGLTLDQLADLLRQRSGRPVQVVRDVDLAQFRAHLRRANDPRRRYLVNFHRGPLFGRGHGHFSPVLGYLEAEDLVLVGDVNAEYRPFLVASERLWRGTDTVDAATGLERGLLWIELVPGDESPR